MDIKEVLFYDLEELFGEGIELTERTTEYGNICDIPSALHSFYKKYSFAKMPFGSIFTVEEARKMSYQQPFMDEEWFCFGQDNYGFVFWLCKEVDGRTFFNAWDHDMSVRRHIVGGANRTLFSVDLPPRWCRTGTCRRLQSE